MTIAQEAESIDFEVSITGFVVEILSRLETQLDSEQKQRLEHWRDRIELDAITQIESISIDSKSRLNQSKIVIAGVFDALESYSGLGGPDVSQKTMASVGGISASMLLYYRRRLFSPPKSLSRGKIRRILPTEEDSHRTVSDWISEVIIRVVEAAENSESSEICYWRDTVEEDAKRLVSLIPHGTTLPKDPVVLAATAVYAATFIYPRKSPVKLAQWDMSELAGISVVPIGECWNGIFRNAMIVKLTHTEQNTGVTV
ncbi:MAG: hypothetical protein ACW968_06995 [Candidatus Thorarchaeota archaeon]|jgi:hypothetical protein